MMVQKALSTLSVHPAIANRGPGLLYRNLYAILFGPMFATGWEQSLAREESRSSKNVVCKTNGDSLKRLKAFFEGKKARGKSGTAMSLAFINPGCNVESFDHRMLLLWLGGPSAPRLFKLDAMKRSGVADLTAEQTTWPAALIELSEQETEALWAAIQVFVSDKQHKGDWSKEKQEAWDTIVSRPGVTPFAEHLALKGAQTFCAVTNDEELTVSLQNGLVERLKMITAQLEAMK